MKSSACCTWQRKAKAPVTSQTVGSCMGHFSAKLYAPMLRSLLRSVSLEDAPGSLRSFKTSPMARLWLLASGACRVPGLPPAEV